MQERVTKILKQMYDRIDPVAQEAAKREKASCKEGCAHCCYMLATVTLSEGILIAENILNRPDWEKWVVDLVAAAQEFCYVGITKKSYFLKKKPCVFLGPDNLCQIYEDRPSACRYHYVVTPSEQCSPDVEGRTGAIDLLPLQRPIWELSMHLGAQLGMALPIIGPIPLVTLACMLLICQDHSVKDFLRKTMEPLPTPTVWIKEFAMELIREGDDDVPLTDDEMNEIKTVLREDA